MDPRSMLGISILSTVLGLMIVGAALVWPDVQAAVKLDAVLTPEELRDDRTREAVRRILGQGAERTSTGIYLVLGAAVAAVNGYGALRAARSLHLDCKISPPD